MLFKTLTKKDLKREKIIESAFDLFAKKDFHDVMIEDVAKSAGIAKGTIYSYFTSKEDLYFSIIKMRMENLVESLKNKINKEEIFHFKLHSFVTHLYMFMVKYHAFYLIYKKEYLKENFELCERIKTLENELHNLLLSIIKETNGETDIELLTQLCFGCLNSGIDRAIKNQIKNEDLFQERNKIYYFILNGINKGVLYPLKNKTIIISRDENKSNEDINKLQILGANVVPISCFEIQTNLNLSPEETGQLKNKYNLIVFTSANAVTSFIEILSCYNINFDFDKTVVASVGKKTTDELLKHKIKPNITADKFTSSELTAVLLKQNLKGKTILFPSSSLAGSSMQNELEAAGAVFTKFTAYNNVYPCNEKINENIARLKDMQADALIFTSPSAFNNFIRMIKSAGLNNYMDTCTVAAIGPTTADAIKAADVHVNIIPEEHTINGIIKSLIKFYNK